MLSRIELRHLLALQRVPNLGDTSVKKLIHHVGSAEGVFKESRKNLLKIEGITSFRLKEFNPKIILDLADEELAFIHSNEISVLHFKDEDYPNLLKQCYDAPLLIFTKGSFNLKNRPIISIVGTRNATTYGATMCEKLVSELAVLNPVIVSGFAYGIDIIAHKAALASGLQTISCLAHGLNQIYPRVHEKYVSAILNNGGLFTEFWSNDAFNRENFLKRNRIIAGMSEATIVVESAEKGGSLVTADIANSYDRDVFAFPGKASDNFSKGCNALIKTQQAQMIESAADLIYLLGWDLDTKKQQPVQTELFVSLSEEEEKVVSYLRQEGKEILDIIALGCQLPTYKTASILLNLEMKGLVQPLPGKQFQLT
ncbi:DNA-processing protein DprA [Aureitalea sp. L0-47]|uniref:DNA-processing protein DprA n=1 Tax=Aureitalea sp. L0-47 TaxID=2816962 RepID=UPI002237BD53|nr:DNA-processing protein DprA [Aureitalea sp. L0-47]MCW5519990.1 DNA-processing protein DprA [Aureitalea sp. L0-47]